MTSGYRNPAIYAGLAGAVAWGQPQAAHALSLFGQQVELADTAVTFVAGCFVGALVASGTMVAADRLSHRAKASSQPVHEIPVGVPRSRAAKSAAGMGEPDLGTGNAASGIADAVEERDAASSGRDTSPATGAQSSALTGAAATDEDYVAVAERYVKSRNLASRMASRARGVANVLGERLSSSRMRDLPVIERADGTVADVGEKWWDEAISPEQTFAGKKSNAELGQAESVDEGLLGNSAALFCVQTPEEARAAREHMARERAAKAWDFAQDEAPTAKAETASSADAPTSTACGVDSAVPVAPAPASSAAARCQSTADLLASLAPASAPEPVDLHEGGSAPYVGPRPAADLRVRANIAARKAAEQRVAREETQPVPNPDATSQMSVEDHVEAMFRAAEAEQRAELESRRAAQAAAAVTSQMAVKRVASPSATSSLRQTIGRRLANPAEVYPEHRSEGDRWSEEQQDLWDIALKALDERIVEQVAFPDEPEPVAFEDDLGGADTLEEPDGLEASTDFIPFRPIAGHPEVNDTNKYVDMLVDQELSRNASPAARKSFRKHLRVIDGGTASLSRKQQLHPRPRSGGSGPMRGFVLREA